MRAVNKMQIKGFRSIQTLDLELQPLNILIGANGAGKSNFLDSFRFLNHLAKRRLQLFVGVNGGADRLLHFGRKMTSSLHIKLSLMNSIYECQLVPTTDDRLVFAVEAIAFHNQSNEHDSTPLDLGAGHHESQLPALLQQKSQVVKQHTQQLLETIDKWQVYHFHDTSESAKVKQTGDIDDNHFLRANAENLAAMLYLFKKVAPAHYEDIVRTIRLVAPFFDQFILRPSPLNPQKIKLEWLQKGSDTYFNASALSDGTLRFISLATLLLQPDLPPTILLDEPELGLHPYAIAILADLIISAATKSQLIVSTQSVTFVEEFAPEEIIVVEHLQGESTFKRLMPEKIALWLEEYTIGELWEKNILGGRPA